MLCIISPAKSLAANLGLVLPQAVTQPPFLDKTNALVVQLKRKLRASDYKKMMSVSEAIASRTHAEYQSWNADGAKLTPAGLLFDGPAYKGLDVGSLSPTDVAACGRSVRFLSGLYGLLRATDEIQDHRLEMGTKGLPLPVPVPIIPAQKKKASPKETVVTAAAPTTLYEYWHDPMLAALSQELGSHGILLNCASQEYAKAMPLAKLEPTVKVINCTFTDQGSIKSVYAKRARGLMSRYVSTSPEIAQVLAAHETGKLQPTAFHTAMETALCSFDLDGYRFVSKEAAADGQGGVTLLFDRNFKPPKPEPFRNAPGSAKAVALGGGGSSGSVIDKGAGKRKAADVDECVTAHVPDAASNKAPSKRAKK